jgi:sortase A
MTALQDAPPVTDPAPGRPPIDGARRSWRAWRPGRLPLPRAPEQRSQVASLTVWISFALAGMIGWVVLYALGASTLEERHDQARLYAELREQLSAATAPIGGVIQPGSPVALMSMPAAGLERVVVVEGTASGDLTQGPGHRRDTPLPGQAGVSVIYGRATLFGGPFGRIASSAIGAPITVTTGQGVARFKIIDVRRAGDPFPPALAGGAGRLTLVTADGGGWRSGWAANHVVYVDAELQGRPYPAPGGRPLAVPKAELALNPDTNALFPLVLWLPLLGIAVLFVVWVAQRWSAWQTWLIGLPVLLACLWGTTEAAVRLLPNLL